MLIKILSDFSSFLLKIIIQNIMTFMQNDRYVTNYFIQNLSIHNELFDSYIWNQIL